MRACRGHVIFASNCFNLLRGIPSIVDDGKTGYLVQTKNSDVLALRIEKLLSDRQLRTEMGLQARLCYEREFTRPKHLSSLARVFAEVVR